ncbi:MAG: hypothetical protein ACXWQO_13025 [Bdellovibrionota bacterium]
MGVSRVFFSFSTNAILAFALIIAIQSSNAFGEVLSDANKEHLQSLRTMEANLRKLGKAGPLAKIQAEIARIQSVYKLGSDDQPLKAKANQNSNASSGYKPYEYEDFSKVKTNSGSRMYAQGFAFASTSLNQGGLGLDRGAAASWADQNEKNGISESDLKHFIEKFKVALQISRTRMADGGFGMGDKDAREWAIAQANQSSLGDIKAFGEKFKVAVQFASTRVGAGGLGMGDQAAREWSIKQANTASLGDIKAYGEKFKVAVQFANARVADGGLGMGDQAAKEWAIDQINGKSASLTDLKSYAAKYKAAVQFARMTKRLGGLGLEDAAAMKWATTQANNASLRDIQAHVKKATASVASSNGGNKCAGFFSGLF